MSIKLSRETTLLIDHEDMTAVLTDQLCGFNALAGLQVEFVDVEDDGRTFRLTLTPRAKDEDQ